MEGMGEGKLYFLLLKSVKRQERPLGQSVLTNFVTDYLYLNRCLCLYAYLYLTSKCICICYITTCMIIEPIIGYESTLLFATIRLHKNQQCLFACGYGE